MDKWQNNKAWFLVLPAFIIVAFSAFIPLMTVVNYSIQDIFGPGQSVFVGTEWFKEMLGNHRLHDALWRQFLFSGLVLLIEIPLVIMIALAMPTRGWGVSAWMLPDQDLLVHLFIGATLCATSVGITARVLKEKSPETKIVVCEPDNSPLLGSGIPQARSDDGSPTQSHPSFRPHLMQGWSPDFVSRLTEEAIGAGRREPPPIRSAIGRPAA